MPQISKNINPVRSSAVSPAVFYADITGAGAAAPTVSTAAQFGLRDNFAQPQDGVSSTITRAGVGDYSITLPAAPPSALKVMSVSAEHRGANTGGRAKVSGYTVTNGRLVLSLVTLDAAGASFDLTTGDFVRIRLELDLSNS